MWFQELWLQPHVTTHHSDRWMCDSENDSYSIFYILLSYRKHHITWSIPKISITMMTCHSNCKVGDLSADFSDWLTQNLFDWKSVHIFSNFRAAMLNKMQQITTEMLVRPLALILCDNVLTSHIWVCKNQCKNLLTYKDKYIHISMTMTPYCIYVSWHFCDCFHRCPTCFLHDVTIPPIYFTTHQTLSHSQQWHFPL